MVMELDEQSDCTENPQKEASKIFFLHEDELE